MRGALSQQQAPPILPCGAPPPHEEPCPSHLEHSESGLSVGSAFASLSSLADSLEPEDLLSDAQFGLADHRGGRTSNDDRHTAFSQRLPGGRRASHLAVFDGHHGHAVADLLCAALPRVLGECLQQEPYDVAAAQRAAVRALDDLAWEAHVAGRVATGGSTLLLLTLVDDCLFAANVGDCKALLSVGPAGTVNGVAAALNTCHNPNVPAERTRFEAAGLGVASDHMSGSDLNVCRSLGDYDLGAPLKWRDEQGNPAGPITPEPEIVVRRLDPNDEFAIVASDGLWDYWSPDSSVLTDSRRRMRAFDNDAQHLADWLVEEAVDRQRRLLHEGTPGDNITVAVLRLRRLPKLTKRFGSSRLNLVSRQRCIPEESSHSPRERVQGSGGSEAGSASARAGMLAGTAADSD